MDQLTDKDRKELMEERQHLLEEIEQITHELYPPQVKSPTNGWDFLRSLIMWSGIVIVALFVMVYSLEAKAGQVVNVPQYHENHFNKEVCAYLGGASDFTVRVAGKNLKPDCVTGEHVYEADWGYKIYEALGQTIVYQLSIEEKLDTQKRFGMILYIREEDQKLKSKDSGWIEVLKDLGIDKEDGFHIMIIYTNRYTGEWTIKEQFND